MIINLNVFKKPVTGEAWPLLSPELNQIQFLVSDLDDAKYALKVTAVDGYLVDWGDGSEPEAFDSEEVAEHAYTVGAGVPFIGGGYTFWVITISATEDITSFNCNYHSTKGVNTDYGYLAAAFNVPTLAGIGPMFNGTLFAAPHLTIVDFIADMPDFTDLSYLVQGPNQITTIDLTHFTEALATYQILPYTQLTSFTAPANFSNVTAAQGMLSSMPELLTADITAMTSLQNAQSMFNSSPKLKTINASGLVAITTSPYFILACSDLETLDIRDGNFSTVMIDAIIDTLPVNATPDKILYCKGNPGTAGVTHTKSGWTIDTTT